MNIGPLIQNRVPADSQPAHDLFDRRPLSPMQPANLRRLAELEEQNRRLKMGNEFLKSRGLLRQGAGLAEKVTLIETEKDNFPIAWMRDQLTRLVPLSVISAYLFVFVQVSGLSLS